MKENCSELLWNGKIGRRRVVNIGKMTRKARLRCMVWTRNRKGSKHCRESEGSRAEMIMFRVIMGWKDRKT
jgi:hypothetical protein